MFLQITANHRRSSMCSPASDSKSVNNATCDYSSNCDVKKISRLDRQTWIVQPLLTDYYHLSMAYSYWLHEKSNDFAVFEVFFRKCPFNGEITIFAGVEECVKFIRDYKFDSGDLEWLRKVMPSNVDSGFFSYLENLNMNDIAFYAVPEGTPVFPSTPLIRLEGALGKLQLLETTVLTLVNYASLVATNAVRYKSAASGRSILEFGLRRAQGPDGALSASRYCYIGGCDYTSNVLASRLYDIPLVGTIAHSFVMSYQHPDEITNHYMRNSAGKKVDFKDLCISRLNEVTKMSEFELSQCHLGELAAFIAFAISNPSNFIALVDTYNVLRSGVPNFCAVAIALNDVGFKPLGIRLDSGDLLYLSNEVKRLFSLVGQHFQLDWFEKLNIFASNEISVDVLLALKQQNDSITSFGVGTKLVTCFEQPSLGCVYKLVELNNKPRLKISEDIEKITIPGNKNLYRLFGSEEIAICDVMTCIDEDAPKPNEEILVRHPHVATKRATVKPKKVVKLLKLYWKDGKIMNYLPTLNEIRSYVHEQLEKIREDHKRFYNPTPYKVSLSAKLYELNQAALFEAMPIGKLK